MALAYTPTNISSGYNPGQINTNMTEIQTALTDGLSRSGAGSNAMSDLIDMGTNDIINVGTVTATEVTVGGVSMAAVGAAAAASAAAAATSESNASTSESNAATSESNASASATLASQWASLLNALVAATDYSAKEWAVGTFTRLASGGGSAKDWANRTGATVDDTEYSAKEYAIGTTVAAGSARDWSIEAEDVLVDGVDYSSFHWAQKAMAIVGGVAGLISSNDTTADYLLNKFTALHGLTWTEINDGGDEDLQISVGSHLEIGGGANNFELNVHNSDSNAVVAHFSNGTTGNTGADGFIVGINSSEFAILHNYENTAMIFATSNTERMRINGAGGLSIGGFVNNETLNLDNSGAVDVFTRFTNSVTGIGATDGVEIGVNSGGTAVIWQYENLPMQFGTNNTTRWLINADGGLASGGLASAGVDTVNAVGISISGYNVGNTSPPSGYTQAGMPIMNSVSRDTTGISIDSTATHVTWESYGPTGSGADNVWTDMDVTPANARFVILKIRTTLSGGTALSSYSAKVNLRAGDSSEGNSSGNEAGFCQVIGNTAGDTVATAAGEFVIVPLDTSDLTFDARWAELGTTPTTNIDAYFVGYL